MKKINRNKKSEFVKSKFTISALVFIFAMFIVYISYSHSEKASTWDEAQYLAIASSLVRGLGYSINFEPETFRPPLYPLLLAGAFKLGGNVIQETAQLVSPILGALTLLVFYYFTSRIFNQRLALLGTVLLAFHPLYFTYSDRVMSEMLFELLVIVCLSSSFLALTENKKWYLLSGISLGLSFLVRFTAVLLLIIIAGLTAYWIWKTRRFDVFLNKYFLSGCVLFILMNLPFAMYQYIQGAIPFSNFLASGLPTITGKVSGWSTFPWYYFLIWLFWEFYGTMVVYAILCAIGLALMKRDEKFIFLGIWVLLPLLYFSANPHKEPRYALFLVPALMAFSAGGVDKLIDRFKEAGAVIGVSCLAISSALSFTATVNFLDTTGDSWYQLRLAGEFLKSTTPTDTILMSSSIPQLYYYSERKVVDFPNDEKDLLKIIQEKNVRYIVLTPERATPTYAYQKIINQTDISKPKMIDQTHIFKLVKLYIDNPVRPSDFALIFELQKI